MIAFSVRFGSKADISITMLRAMNRQRSGRIVHSGFVRSRIRHGQLVAGVALLGRR